MATALLNGLFTGLTLSMMLGTVFFCLIQHSIVNGFRSGFAISTGVIVSDIVLIAISHLNTALMPKGGTTETITRISGAILLMGIGIYGMRPKKRAFESNIFGNSPLLLASKGFMLNIINPANLINWIAISALLKNILHYESGQMYMYYTGALTGIFITEIGISYFASFLKDRITSQFMQRLDFGLGILFIIFAVLLIWPIMMA